MSRSLGLITPPRKRERYRSQQASQQSAEFFRECKMENNVRLEMFFAGDNGRLFWFHQYLTDTATKLD